MPASTAAGSRHRRATSTTSVGDLSAMAGDGRAGRLGFVSLGLAAVSVGLMMTGAGVVPGLALVALGTIGTAISLDKIGDIRKQQKQDLTEIDCTLPKSLDSREAGKMNISACREYNAT